MELRLVDSSAATEAALLALLSDFCSCSSWISHFCFSLLTYQNYGILSKSANHDKAEKIQSKKKETKT